MTAREGDGGAALEDGADGFVLFLDGGSGEGGEAALKAIVDLLESSEVMGIEAADGFDGIDAFGGKEGGVALKVPEVAGDREQAIEAKAINLLERAEFILALTMRLEKLAIFLIHLLAAGVKAEVMNAAIFTEDGAQLLIFFFAFLPSNGDKGDIAVDLFFFHHEMDGGFKPLRAKDNQVLHCSRLVAKKATHHP
jgi:hypothetical protein